MLDAAAAGAALRPRLARLHHRRAARHPRARSRAEGHRVPDPRRGARPVRRSPRPAAAPSWSRSACRSTIRRLWRDMILLGTAAAMTAPRKFRGFANRTWHEGRGVDVLLGQLDELVGVIGLLFITAYFRDDTGAATWQLPEHRVGVRLARARRRDRRPDLRDDPRAGLERRVPRGRARRDRVRVRARRLSPAVADRDLLHRRRARHELPERPARERVPDPQSPRAPGAPAVPDRSPARCGRSATGAAGRSCRCSSPVA